MPVSRRKIVSIVFPVSRFTNSYCVSTSDRLCLSYGLLKLAVVLSRSKTLFGLRFCRLLLAAIQSADYTKHHVHSKPGVRPVAHVPSSRILGASVRFTPDVFLTRTPPSPLSPALRQPFYNGLAWMSAQPCQWQTLRNSNAAACVVEAAGRPLLPSSRPRSRCTVHAGHAFLLPSFLPL